MASLRADHRGVVEGKQRLFLIGSIDEKAHIAPLLGRVSADVVINLRQVDRINSIGVHQWIPALAELMRAYAVEVEEVPVPVVMQANFVANLFSGARVRSCLAPFYCSSCHEARTVVVMADEIAADSSTPRKNCPTCKHELEFDELDGYFAFLRRQPRSESSKRGSK